MIDHDTIRIEDITKKPHRHFGKTGRKHSERRLRELYAMMVGLPLQVVYLDSFLNLTVDYSDDSTPEEQKKQHKRFHQKLVKNATLAKNHETLQEVQRELAEDAEAYAPSGELYKPIKMRCGALACIGGFAALYPKFNNEGLFFRPGLDSSPRAARIQSTNGKLVASSNSINDFFVDELETRPGAAHLWDAVNRLFAGRNGSTLDTSASYEYEVHDKYLALRRIRAVLYASGIITKSRSRELFKQEKKLARKEGIPTKQIATWRDFDYTPSEDDD